MSPARRRRTVLLGLGVLVALLVGGRWLAVETAERAWAQSVAQGDVYLAARDLARLTRGVILLVAIAWGTANLYYVYRAIGSVQLPRRLGDLEIVEAVPQPVLLAGTLTSGILYGVLLTLGTGGWWQQALLASHPPHFGIADPLLHRDLGYYLGELPWAVTCKGFALRATTTAAILVAALYLGIGSLRFNGWRPTASAHTRAHLALVLALFALTLARAALLDPAETVAGLHGSLDRAVLGLRIPGARLLAALSVVTSLATLAWGWRERPRLLVAAWGALLLASAGLYGLVPAVLHDAASDGDPGRARLEALAFGADWTPQRPDPFPSVGAALNNLPVWDAGRVVEVATRASGWTSRQASGTAVLMLPPPEGRARWLVVPGFDVPPANGASREGPDWAELHRGPLARTGRPLSAVEVDSGLQFAAVATRDSAFWFGTGSQEFALAPPDSWPVLRANGIPLVGWWRRTALAWTLQSPELLRHETDGLVLAWRRDVADRLRRLAPFATFETPIPVTADSALWWVSYGYLESAALPLVRPLRHPGRDVAVRYFRAAFVGVVNAASGDTHLYVAPGADSLAGAWAHLVTPLIRPLDRLPDALRATLPFPRDAFLMAARQLVRSRGDSSGWRPRPHAPYEVTAPVGTDRTFRLWIAQAFDSGAPAQLAGLLAGTMSPAGPRLQLWAPGTAVRLPTDVVGSPETAPGVMRLWLADDALFTEQVRFAEPTSGTPKGVNRVFLTLGDRESDGATAGAALHNLLSTNPQTVLTDTTIAVRWELARRLAAQADSALAAGDFETFGRLYGDLKRLMGVSGKLAPLRERR